MLSEKAKQENISLTGRNYEQLRWYLRLIINLTILIKLITCLYFRLNTNYFFQYSLWIIAALAHIFFNALLQVLNRFSKSFYLKSVHFLTVQHKLSRAFQTDNRIRFSHSVPRSGHDFEWHNKNLSSVNYLMTTVKIERAFIHLRSHIFLLCYFV